MHCGYCGREIDERRAHDVPDGDVLVASCGECARERVPLRHCEGCHGLFPTARLASNEATRRLECAGCYVKWRQG
jgi:hypothetical protein